MADRIRQNHEGQHEGRDAGKDKEESVPEIDPQAARDEVLRRAARVNITTVDRCEVTGGATSLRIGRRTRFWWDIPALSAT